MLGNWRSVPCRGIVIVAASQVAEHARTRGTSQHLPRTGMLKLALKAFGTRRNVTRAREVVTLHTALRVELWEAARTRRARVPD